jgi:hypothetical protein
MRIAAAQPCPTAVGPDGTGDVEVLATFVDGVCRFDASETSLPNQGS